MKYQTLGDTGVLVSELCFGAMGFGGTDMWANVGKTQQNEADRLVGIALDAGINFLILQTFIQQVFQNRY